MQLGLFNVGCIFAFRAIDDLCLTTISQHHEFMAAVATDSTAISLNRAIGQATAIKNARISIIHFCIGFIQTSLITVEGISILHNEVAAAHQAKARTTLVAEFVLNLVQIQRQLAIGAHIGLHYGGHHFLVSRAKAIFMAMTIL